MSAPTTGRVPSVFDIAFLTGVEPVAELVLVRHGQQHIPDPGRGPVSDTIDPPLSEVGRQQVERLGERMAHERVDAVYTSTLQRAHDTGLAVAKHHGLQPIVLEDLREIGVFRDVPPEQNALDYFGRELMLGIRERMISEKCWDVYPMSESSFDFRKRTVNAIEGIAATNSGQRVVVACHGGVINAYVAHHLGIKEDMFFRPAHTAVNVVLAGQHGVRSLQSLGDVHHLSPELVTY